MKYFNIAGPCNKANHYMIEASTRLKEERVRGVIEPILLGDFVDVTSDDFLYACDWGLIRMTPQKIEPSNPIYAEVMVRKLNANLQEDLLRNNYE